MKMIRVTIGEECQSVWINPNRILSFTEREGKTEVYYGINESPDLINELPEWLAQQINIKDSWD
jgi:hypothetical protein